jgi:hypothetical protein
MGWSELENGKLLSVAELEFDVFVTTDQSIRHQQNLAGRRLAILVLTTTSWRIIEIHQDQIVTAIDRLRPGDVAEVRFTP